MYPFFGTYSLNINIHQLHRYLEKLPNYTLTARGPIAGYIALHAAPKTMCQQLIIQARGLLAEEYAYAHQHENYFIKPIHWLRKQLFYQLERITFCIKKQYSFPVTIQAVSPALQEYLVKQYGADTKQITLAHDDIPKQIAAAQRSSWRQEIRTILNIPMDAPTYVYNGSAKPWQCPEMIINFFAAKFDENKNAVLLILSQDSAIFKQQLQKTIIPENNYRILHVSHGEIYQYLAAADAGLLFREPHIINWVSRPTKALEYQAVGLRIIHNKTVAWLER